MMEERIGDLIKTSAKYEVLINALVNASEYGYGNSLRFDSDKISAVFQALEPEEYEVRLTEIKRMVEKSAASEI